MGCSTVVITEGLDRRLHLAVEGTIASVGWVEALDTDLNVVLNRPDRMHHGRHHMAVTVLLGQPHEAGEMVPSCQPIHIVCVKGIELPSAEFMARKCMQDVDRLHGDTFAKRRRGCGVDELRVEHLSGPIQYSFLGLLQIATGVGGVVGKELGIFHEENPGFGGLVVQGLEETN